MKPHYRWSWEFKRPVFKGFKMFPWSIPQQSWPFADLRNPKNRIINVGADPC